MKVRGIEITEEQQQEALRIIRCKHSGITLMELHYKLVNIGVHQDAAYRAADRLLQQFRKQGLIEFRKGAWYAVEQETT